MPASSVHRLGHGLPGYLILFDPHAFVPERQLWPNPLPSPLVFFRISTHFTATLGIPRISTKLKTYSIKGSFAVKRRDFTPDLQVRLRTLYTQ